MPCFRTALVLIATVLVAACGGGGGAKPDSGGMPGVDSAPGPGTVTAIPLSSPDGSFYTAQLSVGAQKFAVVVDTGSSSAAVAGSDCSGCGVTPLYMPGSTATDKNMPAMAQFGSGSWTGEIYTDQVGLGAGTPTVPVDLVSISTQKTFFDGNQNAYQGLLGLGGDGLLVKGTSAYLDKLASAGVADVQSFELCDTAGGTMWLGGYDPAATGGKVQYTSTSTALPYYVVQLQNMTLGSTDIGFSSTMAIADTGTSLFYVPTAAADGVRKKVEAASKLFTGSFQQMQGVYCAMAQTGVTATQIDATLPPLALTFPGAGGTPFTVSAPASRSYLFDAGGGMWCIGVADNSALGANITLMGDTALRGFVSVFDRDNQRVGFAPDKGCPSAAAKRAIERERTTPVPLRERGHLPVL